MVADINTHEKPRALQVWLYPKERRLLEQHSEKTGAPMAELVRRAVVNEYSEEEVSAR